MTGAILCSMLMEHEVCSMEHGEATAYVLGQKGGAGTKPLSDRDRANPGVLSQWHEDRRPQMLCFRQPQIAISDQDLKFISAPWSYLFHFCRTKIGLSAWC
jgi:hypothetical protein